MTAPATVAAILRTQGLQFVRNLQGALRLFIMYSASHPQVKSLIQRAMGPLDAVLQETSTLSVGFQFDRVVLNSVPVADPSLAWLAGELVKRRVSFLMFSEGMDEARLARVLTVLSAKPEAIEEQGGIVTYLRANPLEHARIVPVQLAAAEGSLAVVTSAEEAAAIAKVPRWLLRALEQVQASGETRVIGPQELLALAGELDPELTPEQRVLLPQLQEVLARVVRHASTSALAELIRAALVEVGAAGEELLKSVMLQGVTATAEIGDLPQAERVLRSVTELHIEPESMVQMLPQDKVAPEVRQHLKEYALWVARPVEERLAHLDQAGVREFRWVALEIEHTYNRGDSSQAAEVLASLFAAGASLPEAERAEPLTRGRYLLVEICSGGAPPNGQQLVEVISNRLREEHAAVTATPLVESLVTLSQAAADHQDFALATAAASVVSEIAEELSPRGHVARQAQLHLLKPRTLSRLLQMCIARKADPAVSRSIIPLLKRVGDQSARELLALLEKEPVANKRLRILQVIKLLGRSAAEALSEKISDPQWYVVRNAAVAIGEVGDPALLDRLEPALLHADERVQQAAVAAALKTRSPERGLLLARSLPNLKPAVLESVLDDLLVLKEAHAVPYLEKLLRRPDAGIRPHLLQKAVAALGAIGTEDAAVSLTNCAGESSLAMVVRQSALRTLARLPSPTARQALENIAGSETEPALAEEARKLLAS